MDSVAASGPEKGLSFVSEMLVVAEVLGRQWLVGGVERPAGWVCH
jgi:hypothetical protein